jgi:predicted regulator of Ras-like GTPase activity (Roadblock/LC7/MglB family)
MTIPFLDLFKKITGRFGSTAVEEPPSATVSAPRALKKAAGEKLSKTVLPHATRSFSTPDPFRSAAGVGPGRSSTTPLQLGAQRITAAPKKPQSAPLPPALARALEPKLERAISLRIADFIDRVPAGYMKPIEILDTSARVSLKASEIEKGMPEQNPTISLPSLYQQVPEIFLKGVRPDDDTRISLPYEKVLEQFKAAAVRVDQMRDPAVPQVDTPILKATIQDSEKFGTKIEPIETSTLPAVPVKPATAEAIAAAEPDAFVHATTRSTSSKPHAVISLYSADLMPKSEPAAPKNPSRTGSIPFELSPNGTGASASERVPASSGPPVPTPLPLPPSLEKGAAEPAEKSKAPAALKLSEPLSTLSIKPEEKPATVKLPEPIVSKTEEKTVKPVETSAVKISRSEKRNTPAKDEPTIQLPLKAVLKSLPAFQLDGDITAVSDEAQVALPMSVVEPQLPTGRISIVPDVFKAAIPEQYRELFQVDEPRTPVVLPLEEVLKNLPATVLKLRDDQEHFELDKDFETPFSIRAQEDAKKFAIKKTPEEKAESEKKEETAPEAKIDTAPVVEKKLEPKEVVTEVNALAGVKGCAITFSDGLSLAGELPEDAAAEGLCAMAPSILERVAKHVRDTKLGSLAAVTFYTSKSAVSFFAQGSICLTALHSNGSLPAETRTKITALVEKLSEQYTKTE